MPAVPKSGHNDAALPLEDTEEHSETYIVVTLVLTPAPIPTMTRPTSKKSREEVRVTRRETTERGAERVR
jgi:hypothetical protein